MVAAVLHNKKKEKRGVIPEGVAGYFAGEILEDEWICYPWEAVEEEVNKIISMNIRIKDYHVSEKEIPVLKLRRAPKVSGQIRIVEIEGYDKVACGGVHTSSTGDVMFAKILFTEKIRSHVRIAWLLGNRVLPDYRGKMFTVHSLAEIFSAKEDELVASAKKLLDENRTLKKELETLQLDFARR